jgi:hypothetical protein
MALTCPNCRVPLAPIARQPLPPPNGAFDQVLMTCPSCAAAFVLFMPGGARCLPRAYPGQNRAPRPSGQSAQTP